MDILTVIKREHREVAKMLDEAQMCNPGDKRLLEIAKRIERALSTHVQIEERLLYARLRDRAEGADDRIDVLEGYTEHNVADHLIRLLESKRKPDERFKAEMQVLGESVKHHVKEEESTIFRLARRAIEPEEREKLGEDWAKARKRLDSSSSKASK